MSSAATRQKAQGAGQKNKKKSSAPSSAWFLLARARMSLASSSLALAWSVLGDVGGDGNLLSAGPFCASGRSVGTSQQGCTVQASRALRLLRELLPLQQWISSSMVSPQNHCGRSLSVCEHVIIWDLSETHIKGQQQGNTIWKGEGDHHLMGLTCASALQSQQCRRCWPKIHWQLCSHLIPHYPAALTWRLTSVTQPKHL